MIGKDIAVRNGQMALSSNNYIVDNCGNDLEFQVGV
jgi:hypothetical protein